MAPRAFGFAAALLLLAVPTMAQIKPAANFTDALAAIGSSDLEQALAFAQIPAPNSTFKGLIAAPSNTVLRAAQAAIISLSPAVIQSTVAYHIMPGASLPEIPQVFATADTPNNMTVTPVNGTDGNTTWHFFSQVNSSGTTTANNCRTFNNGSATVCQIQAILQVPNTTIYDYIASNPNLSAIKGIIDADPTLKGPVTNIDQAVTVFIPDNAAIKAFTTAYPNATAQDIEAVVFGHIALGVPYSVANAQPGAETRTSVLGAQIPGHELRITSTGVQSLVNGSAAGPVAKYVTTDGYAGKSLVQVIGTVLDVGFGFPQLAAAAGGAAGGAGAGAATEESSVAAEVSGAGEVSAAETSVAAEESSALAETSSAGPVAGPEPVTPPATPSSPVTPGSRGVTLPPSPNPSPKSSATSSLPSMMLSGVMGVALLMMLL